MNAHAPARWPDAVWAAPALRTLDAGSRDRLAAGGRVRAVAAGVEVYAEGAASDSFFIVVDGAVSLRTIRRGDAAASELRCAGPGDTFGEEPLLHAGATRRARAVATASGTVVEIPAALYQRIAGKAETSGAGGVAEIEIRRLRRTATADLLRSMAATRSISDHELALLLDAIQIRIVPRGERIFGVGDRAASYFMVDTGLVQLQREDLVSGEIGVCGYVARGDGFGHEEVLAGTPRTLGAVSMGHTRVAVVPAAVLRTVVDRNPAVARRLSRVQSDRAERQAAAAAQDDVGSTRHVFADLYRMQVARSMLVIDGDSCVRCGHCAWTCASLYGTARLIRRGDKIITQVDALARAKPKSLMVVNSCQHCKNPVCMPDCPTGAIGRDPEGEVFITDALCTGCGACAKACPWENIRMAPRPGVAPGSAATGPGISAQLATKCDLCRTYEAPGCVQACPTDAITRLDPTRDVAAVANVLGVAPAARVHGAPGSAAALGSRATRALSVTLGVSLGAWAVAQRSAGVWVPHEGIGYALGWVAAAAMVGAASYAAIKRMPALWMRRRPKRSRSVPQPLGRRAPPRSKTRAWLDLHWVFGVLSLVGVCGHAGLAVDAGPYRALLACCWVVVGLGVFGAIVYRAIPPRLARLERRASLPEDLAGERGGLLDALYRQIRGTSPQLKALAGRMLIPYARAPWGAALLMLSGRSERQERARVLTGATQQLGALGIAPLSDADRRALEALARIVVELRSVPARRVLTVAVRAWMPLHAALTGILFALLVVHIVIAVGRPG